MIDALAAVIVREARELVTRPSPLGPDDVARLEALCRAARSLRGVPTTGAQPEAPPAESDVAALEAQAK